MEELPWLDGYGGRSTAALLALQGTYRADSLVLAFEEGIQRKIGQRPLTAPERTVLAIEALEREVNNDGYLGFFRHAPEHAPTVVASLEAIGRGDVAELTRRAIAAIGLDVPVTIEAVAASVEDDDADRDGRLNECDSQYFQSAGDLAGPLLEFIRSHADEISLP